MVQQFSSCNAANMRAAVPARICLAGLGGQLAAGLDAVCGAEKWPVRRTLRVAAHCCAVAHTRVTRTTAAQLVRSAASYLEMFPERRANLVYLTADSPNVLPEVSADDIYIIGGIVDRNRHKARALVVLRAALPSTPLPLDAAAHPPARRRT